MKCITRAFVCIRNELVGGRRKPAPITLGSKAEGGYPSPRRFVRTPL